MRTEETRRCCELIEPPDVLLVPDPPLALDVPLVPLPVVPLPVLPVLPLPDVLLPLAIVPVTSTLCPTCFFSSVSCPSST